jgi:hypothetical protein
MENNRLAIDGLKSEINVAKLDHLKENIALTDRLDNLHKSILALSDSIDSFDKLTATKKVDDFIAENFTDIAAFNQTPLEIDEETPRPLLKLHLATLESFLISVLRDNVEGESMKFDNLSVKIITSKTIIKKGEKITGELSLSLEPREGEVNKMFRKMVINGQEIDIDNERLTFEIQPKVEGTGLIRYELNCEAFYRDPKTETIVKGTQVIYIQN